MGIVLSHTKASDGFYYLKIKDPKGKITENVGPFHMISDLKILEKNLKGAIGILPRTEDLSTFFLMKPEKDAKDTKFTMDIYKLLYNATLENPVTISEDLLNPIPPNLPKPNIITRSICCWKSCIIK